MQFIDYKENTLFAENLPITEITKHIATPYYLYSATQIEHNYQAYEAAFKGIDTQICYAVKANSNLAVLSLLAKLGCGADVVSKGELQRAIKVGIKPNKIVFSGVGKTDAEIRFALEKRILQFNVESKEELLAISEQCQQLNMRANIAIRVNPDVDVDTHEKITTGKAENKFGVAYHNAQQVYALAEELPGLSVQAIHVHIGSQINSVAPFGKAFIRVAQLVKALRNAGHTIQRIDVGGGVGVSYERDKEIALSLTAYADMIKQHLSDLDCTILLEPGRRLVANAGVLISAITYIKSAEKKDFVILDCGMNDFVRPSMYEAYHKIAPVNVTQAPLRNYDIVGPVCESGDTFAKNRTLTTLNKNDLVAIFDTGAYGAVMASAYNSRAIISEVLVKDQQFSIVNTGESLEQQLLRESIPNWF